MILISNFDDAMLFGSEVGEGIKFDSFVRNPILKSQFLDLDEKEVDNVIKGGRRFSKLAELWAKNAFDEWKVFHSFDKF
jgi:hypothetical protein